MSYPSWFHVFDSTRHLWLQDRGYEFGFYDGAAEFHAYEAALEAAQKCIKHNKNLAGVLVVIADYGVAEENNGNDHGT